MFSNLNNVGAVEVNAFQVQAEVCIQKSIREGFGLTVSEALWKARPTIAGNVGGIVAQITDGETGYLVSSAEECADRVMTVLADPAATREMTRRAKEHVRRRFLTPRLLRDWLSLMHRMAGEDSDLEIVAAG
jgi:trehalose synthase